MPPIVYITLSYVFGIIAGKQLDLPLFLLLTFSFILLFACLLLFSDKKRFHVAFILLIFVLGMGLYVFRGETPQPGGGRLKEESGMCSPIKNRLTGVVDNMLPRPYSNLLGSIVLGVAVSPPPPEMVEAHRKVGTIHLLVASGQQLSILVGCSMAAFRCLNLSSRLGALIATLLALAFTFIAGAGPSIVRALIMSEMVLASKLLGRDSDPLAALSFSALLILLFDPRVLFNIGFQFSFAATYALLYLAPIIEERFNEVMPHFFASILSVSLAPLALTMPIVAYNFSQVSVIAPVSNALVLPWIEFVVVLGFIAISLGSVFMPLAHLFSGALFLSLKALDLVISITASLPFASMNIKTPGLPLIAGYYMMLACGVHMIKNRIKLNFDKTKVLAVALAIVSVFVWHAALSQGPSPGLLEISVIDAGQGDSILIQTPSGKNILIDGGDKGAGKSGVLPYIRSKGINKLDIVILTHPHNDHVGGLVPVLQSIKVDSILDSGQPHPSRSYVNFLSMIDKNKIKFRLARAGQVLNLGGSCEARVLWPTGVFLKGTSSDLNNNSVVIKLVYKNFQMLFPGDLGKEGERELLRGKASLQSEILKVAHHGSPYSTTPAFLDRVRSRVAIISVGQNDYGHPSEKVMVELSLRGIKTYRTDHNGTVVIRTDGHRYVIISKT